MQSLERNPRVTYLHVPANVSRDACPRRALPALEQAAGVPRTVILSSKGLRTRCSRRSITVVPLTRGQASPT